MAARKRVLKKRPDYRLAEFTREQEDLKKVKAQVLKDLEENQAKKEEWFDQELDKNLKKQ